MFRAASVWIFFNRLSAILVCIVLAGCATYKPRPLDAGQLASSFEARSLTNDALRAYLVQAKGRDVAPWPIPRWNRELLTLAAYYYSPALDIARAQWGTAKAGIVVAGARPNPTLRLPFEYTTNSQGPGRPYTTGVSFEIPAEIAHKRGYRVDRAESLAEVARLKIANEAWKVRGQVRDALFGIYVSQQRLTLLHQKVTTEEQIVAMLRKRRLVGEASGTDVTQMELALSQARIDFAVLLRALQDAQAKLASAIGLPLDAVESVQLDLGEFERTDVSDVPPADARRSAILHRADFLALLSDYASTQAALQSEIAKQYPDLSIGLGYTYDVGANKIGFGLAGVTLPLFDHNQGGIALAEAKRTEVATRAAALQEAILADLAQALTRFAASRHTLQLSSEHLTLADKQRQAQESSFAAGVSDRLTFALAILEYQTSALAHLNDVLTVRQSAAALEDAMQLPLDAVTVDGHLIEETVKR